MDDSLTQLSKGFLIKLYSITVEPMLLCRPISIDYTNDFRGRKINNRQETSLRQRERGRVMHAGMASGLKRRFDDDDDDLSHFARCLKYRLVMTSMICVTLKM